LYGKLCAVEVAAVLVPVLFVVDEAVAPEVVAVVVVGTCRSVEDAVGTNGETDGVVVDVGEVEVDVDDVVVVAGVVVEGVLEGAVEEGAAGEQLETCMAKRVSGPTTPTGGKCMLL
jgi:hypothetical protein